MVKIQEYRIKGSREQYLKVIRESRAGFSVLITSEDCDDDEVKKEFMPRSLFETCLRTDYLTPRC
ncbi:MAG: hypothetical protein MI717_01935 [Spirochaetales bacterium]|nr:hypothetical protein [Spirochaetales bacterium]